MRRLRDLPLRFAPAVPGIFSEGLGKAVAATVRSILFVNHERFIDEDESMSSTSNSLISLTARLPGSGIYAVSQCVFYGAVEDHLTALVPGVF